MPRGPKGEKRPADVIGNAVRVMRIATGEIDDTPETEEGKDLNAKALGRKGGKARAEKMQQGGAQRSLGRRRRHAGNASILSMLSCQLYFELYFAME